MGMEQQAMIVAHRGASGEYPEHTLVAYQQAIAQGAEGLECDIRLSSDGHLVCVHDRTVERTTTVQGVVSEMTLAELRELSIAGEGNQRILELRELLELYQDTRHEEPHHWDAEKGKFSRHLFIETKHPVRYGPLVERSLHKILCEYGLDGDSSVHIISFSAQSLFRMKMWQPEMDRIFLRRVFQGMLTPTWLALGAADSYGLSVARARLVESQTAAGEQPETGNQVPRHNYMWTINSQRDMDIALKSRVRYIASDHPGEAIRWREESLKKQAAARAAVRIRQTAKEFKVKSRRG